jgi:hypothetical protein
LDNSCRPRNVLDALRPQRRTRAAPVGLTLSDYLSRELRELLQHAFTDIASVELVQQ